MEVARTNLSFSSSGEAHTTVILPPALDAQDTAEMVQHAPRMSPQLPVLNSSRPCLNSTSRGCEIKQDSSHKHPKKETNYYYCNPLATCNELLAGEAVEREHNAITGEQGCRYTQLVRTVFLDAMNQSTKTEIRNTASTPITPNLCRKNRYNVPPIPSCRYSAASCQRQQRRKHALKHQKRAILRLQLCC